MLNIQVSGPEHSKKGYIMVEIARVLREAGCEVTLQGEETHLVEKAALTDDSIRSKIAGQKVVITEMQTTA